MFFCLLPKLAEKSRKGGGGGGGEGGGGGGGGGGEELSRIEHAAKQQLKSRPRRRSFSLFSSREILVLQ